MPEQVYIKLGEEWLVVTCHNDSCGRRILIDPVGPEMRDDEGDIIFPADTVLVICPHCELELLYRSDEIRCEQGQRRKAAARAIKWRPLIPTFHVRPPLAATAGIDPTPQATAQFRIG